MIRPLRASATFVAKAALALAFVLVVPRTARAARIPPGQEALAMQMLGGAAALAGGCHLDDASIQPDHVEARYRCPGAAAPWGVSLLPPEATAPPGQGSTR